MSKTTKKTTEQVLEDAIIEAKTIRDAAIENAKKSLVETFNPQIQSMLSATLQKEEEEVEDEDEIDGEMPTDDVTVDTDVPAEAPVDDVAVGDDSDTSVDEIPADDETEDEVVPEVDVIDDVPTDEVPPVDGEDDDEELGFDVEDDETEDDSEELDMNALKKFFSEENSDLEVVDSEDEKEKMGEVKQLRAELAKMNEAVVKLTAQLKEVNLLNAKLLRTSQIFKENEKLTTEQKKKIIATFDKAKTVAEVSLVYETIKSTYAGKTTPTAKKTVTEAAGASRPAPVKQSPDEIQVLETLRESADRLRKLAGLNRNVITEQKK